MTNYNLSKSRSGPVQKNCNCGGVTYPFWRGDRVDVQHRELSLAKHGRPRTEPRANIKPDLQHLLFPCRTRREQNAETYVDRNPTVDLVRRILLYDTSKSSFRGQGNRRYKKIHLLAERGTANRDRTPLNCCEKYCFELAKSAKIQK